MKDDNLSDDKSSLQASVLVFFILSTKSYTEQSSVELSQFQSTGYNRLMKTEVDLNCMISM